MVLLSNGMSLRLGKHYIAIEIRERVEDRKTWTQVATRDLRETADEREQRDERMDQQ